MTRLDNRHTVTLEFTGHISGQAQHIARFCDEWCGQSETRQGALQILEALESLRKDEMIHEVNRQYKESK